MLNPLLYFLYTFLCFCTIPLYSIITVESYEGKIVTLPDYLGELSEPIATLIIPNSATISFREFNEQHLFTQTKLGTYKGLRFFELLLRKFYFVKQHNLDNKEMLSLLHTCTLSYKIESCLLAELFELQELKHICSFSLAQDLTDINYLNQLRYNNNFYQKICSIQSFPLRTLVAYMLINQNICKNSKFFSKLISKTHLPKDKYGIQALHYIPQEEKLISLNNSNILYSNSIDNLTYPKQLGHKSRVTCFAVSPDNLLLGTACLNTVTLWSAGCSTKYSILEIPTGQTIQAINFDASSNYLAALSDLDILYVWSICSKINPVSLFTVHYQERLFPYVSFKQTSTHIILVTLKGAIIEYNCELNSFTILANLEKKVTHVTSNLQRSLVALATFDNSLFLIRLNAGEIVINFTFGYPLKQILISADNRYLFITGYNTPVLVWDIVTGSCLTTLGNNRFNGIALGKDSDHLFLFSSQGQRQLVDISTLKDFTQNELFLEQMLFITLFSNVKQKLTIDREKPHIQTLYSSFEPPIKKITTKAFHIKSEYPKNLP